MPFPHNPFFLLGHLVMYTSGLPAGLHPRGGNRLFSKGSLFLRGLPCPREKQHLFFKEFLLFSKTLLQTFFPKAATVLVLATFTNLFSKGCSCLVLLFFPFLQRMWVFLLAWCLFSKGYSCWHVPHKSTKSATAATKSGYTWIPFSFAHWCLSQ